MTAIPASAEEPVATVNGVSILASDLPIAPEERKLRQQLYALQGKALGEVIANMLLEEEAKRRSLTVNDLIQTEVNPKVGAPTNAEIRQFYEQNKARIKKPLKEVRDSVVSVLKQAKARRHLNDLIAEIRSSTEVEIMLEPPRLPIDLEGVRSRGPSDASVTVVEFSDFQCPYCKKVQPALNDLVEQYQGKVRWVFKDLPLEEVHPEAKRAAQAARCAGDQGKFWEYRAVLFEKELFTDDMYREVARELELETDRLMECIASGKNRELVEKDRQEARMLGLDGTPAILVNGILLTGARPIQSYKELIDRELERTAEASP